MSRVTHQTIVPYEHWWHALPCVPPQDSDAYRRLRRVWADQTWKTNCFGTPTHENHFTSTLFENFALFEPAVWVERFLVDSNVPAPGKVFEARWSYEYECSGAAKGHPIADVVIWFRTDHTQHVCIIEAKLPGQPLRAAKDLDPATYLDCGDFSRFERSFVYVLGTAVAKRSVDRGRTGPAHRVGVLTWERLGGLQVELAKNLAVDPPLKGFIAGAIHYQFLHHGIVPSAPPFDYLESEPPLSRVGVDLWQTTEERRRPLWLPEGEA